MYQALYRKWRPQVFDDVIGQDHITRVLKNQIISGRLSHAYLFIGTRGTGKTTCARILAKAVNCENPVNGNPCCRCASCRGIADGSIMDIVELDAASNNGVDNVRALREEAVFSPAEVRKRVYIIDEVHMLSTAAFNALLKILEEPPEHLMFILATTELNKVPATILSRCQRHSFKRVDADVISRYLLKIAAAEKIGLDASAAKLIARMADGGVRDALSLLDQCSAYDSIDQEAVYAAIGLSGNRRIAVLFDKVVKGDTEGVLNDFSSLWMDGKDPSSFLDEISTLLRDILILKVAPKTGASLISGTYSLDALNYFIKRLTNEELMNYTDIVQSAIRAMKDVRNPKTAAELCLVSLCDSSVDDSISALKARISRLEDIVTNGGRTFAAATAVYTPVMTEPEKAPEFLREENFIPRENENTASGPLPAYSEENEEPDPDEYRQDTADIPEEDEPRYAEETEEVGAVPEEPRQTSRDTDLDEEQLWNVLVNKVSATVPKLLSQALQGGEAIKGSIKDDTLTLYAEKALWLDRLKKQNVQEIFGEPLRSLTGRNMRVVLEEMPDDMNRTETRSINELKQFPEVTFVR